MARKKKKCFLKVNPLYEKHKVVSPPKTGDFLDFFRKSNSCFSYSLKHLLETGGRKRDMSSLPPFSQIQMQTGSVCLLPFSFPSLSVCEKDYQPWDSPPPPLSNLGRENEIRRREFPPPPPPDCTHPRILQTPLPLLLRWPLGVGTIPTVADPLNKA